MFQCLIALCWLSCLCGRQCFDVGALHCNCKCGFVLKVQMFWIDNLFAEVAQFEALLVSCCCGCSQILFVFKLLLSIMYVVRVLNVKVFQIGMFGFHWSLCAFQCSCHWVTTHAVCRMCLGLFGSYGSLFSKMLFVVLRLNF